MNIVIAIIIFGLIIAIHEFGHFIVAKLCGVGVVEFSIGMGPLLIGHRFGETFYSLRLIPFGGYCAMYGEESIEAKDKGQEEEKIEKEKKYRIPFLHRKPNYKDDWTKNRALNSKHPLQKMCILIAGPFFNLFLGFIISMIMNIVWGANVPLIVEKTIDNSSAYEVGIQTGDLVTKVNDRNVLTYADFNEYTITHHSKIKDGYSITLIRDGKTHVFQVVPDKETNLVGLHLANALEKKSFPQIIKYSFNDLKYWSIMVFDSLNMLITNEVSAKEMSGAVGITSFMGTAINEAKPGGLTLVINTILTIVCLISINLGIMNLLPFPALDGGRTILCLFELITKRKVPIKFELAINTIGMLCLIFLMVFTLFNDIMRIIV